MKLYRVRTIVDQFHGCQNVPFDWFGCNRREPRRCAELIDDYSAGDLDQEVAIDEMCSPKSKRSRSKNISSASMAAQG
jgi:hypothetical protein